jgi:hypothetical protein
VVHPEARRRVLQEGLQELSRIRGDIIDFKAYSPPAPDRLVLRFSLRSVMGVRGGRPIYSASGRSHVVEFVVPGSYPEIVTPNDIRFTTDPIFHPNVFADGRICIGSYVSTESLGRFVLRIARMIRFEPAFINENSAANRDAVPWYLANLHSFPVDRRPLPSLDRLILGQTKRQVTLGPHR